MTGWSACRRTAPPPTPRSRGSPSPKLRERRGSRLSILVTAQGLLPYFQRDQVHRVIAEVAERLPGSLLVFDVVPDVMLDMVRRASGRERDLAVELWTWLFNPGERAAISPLPGVEELRDLAPPLKRGLASLGITAIGRTPAALALLAACVPGAAGQIPRGLRALNCGRGRGLGYRLATDGSDVHSHGGKAMAWHRCGRRDEVERL